MRHSCGCVNAVHTPSGVLRSVSKCPRHQRERRDPATLGRAYYEELGVLADSASHLRELTEALGHLPVAPRPGALALEIGCGASRYAPALRAAAYAYLGLEPSPWAAEWTRQIHSVPVVETRFEDYEPGEEFALILAAHCLEHLEDAPGAIARCARWLEPGGQLWSVVPDDGDPTNPDHVWIFTEPTLRACLEAAGLVVDRLVVRRRIARELFIYARARKPG